MALRAHRLPPPAARARKPCTPHALAHCTRIVHTTRGPDCLHPEADRSMDLSLGAPRPALAQPQDEPHPSVGLVRNSRRPERPSSPANRPKGLRGAPAPVASWLALALAMAMAMVMGLGAWRRLEVSPAEAPNGIRTHVCAAAGACLSRSGNEPTYSLPSELQALSHPFAG